MKANMGGGTVTARRTKVLVSQQRLSMSRNQIAGAQKNNDQLWRRIRFPKGRDGHRCGHWDKGGLAYKIDVACRITRIPYISSL